MSNFGFAAFSPRQNADMVITQRVEVEVQARTAASSPNTSGLFAYIRAASASCWRNPLRDKSPVRW